MSGKYILLPKKLHICVGHTTLNTGGYEQLNGKGLL